MAKSKNKSKNRRSGEGGWSNEVAGISLIGGGLLLLLSLVSYTPSDLPMGIPFTGATWLDGFAPDGEANNPRHNFIGPVGALLGFCQIQLLGAAGYLLSLGLIWMGVGRWFFEAEFTWRTWIGFAILLVSGASLLGVQGAFFAEWPDRYWIVSSGGAIGKALGIGVFKNLLNTAGSVIVLSVVYLASTFLLLGLHPVKFTKGLAAWTMEMWSEQVMPRIESLRTGKKPKKKSKAKSAAKPKKAAAKKLEEEEEEWEYEDDEEEEEWEYEDEEEEVAAAYEEEEGGQVTLPLQEVPKPQIIDASKRAKPLADIGARPFERKKKQHAALTTEGFEDYELPGFDLLEYDDDEAPAEDNSDELMATQKTIVETCKAFGVDVTAGDITRGPTITRYEIYPSLGLRVSRIAQLEPDLARATRAERINILAPIPGKDTVGIEIANDKRMPVALRELLQDDEFRSSKKKIPLALGKDVYGRAVIGDLAAMPHCLVAGATGAGKSVCINSIIASMLFKFGPDELRFIMVDPKVVEMQMYAKLPHLVVPVVTDPRKVVGALKWCVNEMERRYKIFAKEGVRNFDSFNSRVRKDEEKLSLEQEEETEEEEYEEEDVVEGEEEEWEYEEGEDAEGEEEEWEYEEEEGEEEIAASDEESEEEEDDSEEEEADMGHVESIASALEDGELGPTALGDDDDGFGAEEDEVPDRFPYIVVIIDELADLMQTAPADVEMCIARIAQKARAAGIHLIIATQTPRADVVTGIIKANIPSRIAFQVSSSLDSRVILDTKGAEKLVGKGDMLFLPPGSAKLERAQGAFVSDEEVESIVQFCSTQSEQKFEESIQKEIESGGDAGGDDEEVNDADEECLQRCIEVVMTEQKASTSLLQRRLRLGYTRAARMIDILEQRGIVGPADGAKPREVYAGAAAAAAE